MNNKHAKDELSSVDMTSTQEKDKRWLAKLEKRFNTIAGTDNQIRLEEFKQALNVKKSFFAERSFELMDTDRSGSISLTELIEALRVLVYGSASDKLHFLFRIYDADESGYIDFEELRTVLRSCTVESALTLSEETLTELTEILFDDADVDGDGQISFEELCTQLKRYPGITANLSISPVEWLNPKTSNGSGKNWKSVNTTCLCCSLPTLRNRLSLITFVTIYIIINVALLTWGAYEGYWSAKHGQNPAAITVARSTGRCLSFNCCFILVLMLRKLLTILRNSFLTSMLPLDQHVAIHKVVGVIVSLFTAIHIVGHVANFALIAEKYPNETTLVEYLFTPVSGIGWICGSASITGVLLTVVLGIMVLCSMPCIRRNGYFKVFYWTHQLCIVFWVLLFLHSSTFWAWFILPGIIYFVERILRLQIYRRARFGITYIQDGFILPANVTHLVIQRPPKFKFHAGEYIYVNIPDIASHEWHPFTISSAPEQQEFLSLHVRSLGHWTRRLYNFFKERDEQKLKESVEDVDDEDEDVVRCNGDHEKPLDVLAEEGSVRSSAPESPIPRATTEKSGSKRASPRKRALTGETNSGFESDTFIEKELPGVLRREDDIVTFTVGADSQLEQIHDQENVMGSESVTEELPGAVNVSQNSVLSEENIESGTKLLTLKTLNTVESIDNQNSVQTLPTILFPSGHKLATEASIPNTHSNTDFSIARGNIVPLNKSADNTTRRSASARRRNSRKKVRRMHTMHSLDAARSLCGTPHTGMEIILDGPYGAPAQHIMDAEHAVLIGAGIGITPFASILQSIHERYKAAKKHCPNCRHAWVEDASTILKTKKVDFFWINRQQRSFEWFISLLNEIEIEQKEIPLSGRFLDIHLYMTSALSPSDMKAIGLHVALDLIHKKNKRDTITGLMTRTQPGRPDWDEVFQNLRRQQQGKITVFFCGSATLGKIIRRKCVKYKMDFRKENF